MKNNFQLTTERLLLKSVKKEDAKAIFSYRSDADTNQYQGWIPDNIEDVHLFLEKVSEEINISSTWFQFVIVKKANNEIIGDCGIHFIDEKQVELGCTLRKSEHGKGLATEALRAVINYLFNDLKKHRITGSIDPENKKSIGLMERLGFRKEGHFKESIFLNEKWVDDLVYAMLRKEWNN